MDLITNPVHHIFTTQRSLDQKHHTLAVSEYFFPQNGQENPLTRTVRSSSGIIPHGVSGTLTAPVGNITERDPTDPCHTVMLKSILFRGRGVTFKPHDDFSKTSFARRNYADLDC
jgi:hypothetical protein